MCPSRTGATGGTTLVHSLAQEISSRTIIADIVLSVIMSHTGIIVHNVATAHILCGGPDQLGEVSHLQVAATVHGGVLVEQLHL